MPVSYVGPIEAVLSSSSSEPETAERTVDIRLVHGGNDGQLLTSDPTIFKVLVDETGETSATEIYRFVVDTPETVGYKTVESMFLSLVWQTKVLTVPGAVGETYWEIGPGEEPTSEEWATLTDTFAAADVVTEHGVSGATLPTEAASLPFTLRLLGKVTSSGTLQTQLLSSSTVQLTYKVSQ